MSNDTIKPIFYDPSERRAGRVQYTGILIAILAATFFTLFWASILFVPISQRLRLTPPKFLPDMSLHPGNGVAPPKTTPRRDDPLARSSRTKPFPSAVSGKAQGVVGGFYVSWDQASLASLREHAGEMTHIFPSWLHINQSGDGLIIRDTDPTDAAPLLQQALILRHYSLWTRTADTLNAVLARNGDISLRAASGSLLAHPLGIRPRVDDGRQVGER